MHGARLRTIKQRKNKMLIARFILETVNPLHCGGNSDPILDQPVSRDAYGNYMLPGTSVAGVLRQFSSDLLGEQATKQLFGEINGTSTVASSVWCSDACLLDYDETEATSKLISGKDVNIPTGPFVRDHVKLELQTGVTSRGGKYDEEIVPLGARFSLELRADEWNEDSLDKEMHDNFLKLCSALKNNEIIFGGKRTNGYGHMFCKSCEVCEIDRHDPEQMLLWLKLNTEVSFKSIGIKTIELTDNKAEAVTTDRISGELEIPLKADGPVIVGGTNLRDLDEDMVCLLTPHYDYENATVKDLYTIPGSSLRGAIRHNVFRIANILGKDGSSIVDSIFGKIGVSEDKKENESTVGKVQVSDFYFDKDCATKAVQHVAIDRFIGGALEGALYDEKPVWSENEQINLTIKFKELTIEETKILMHSILDIVTGLVPIGGGVNRGNGTMHLCGMEDGLSAALDSNVPCHVLWNGDVYGKGDLSTFLELLDEE